MTVPLDAFRPTPTTFIMPPLPTTLSEELLTTVDSLRRRRTDLSDFQIPRLRNCTGPLAIQQQYAAELREDLDTFARQVDVRLYLKLHRLMARISE